MSRADLLALTPASVAALTNLGLVKRAQREIAAGNGPRLEEDAQGLVIGTFDDGVVTRLAPGVPLRDAPCTCGSVTVCRHRVAVALAYPAWHQDSVGEESAAPGVTPIGASSADQTARTEPKAEPWSPSCFGDDQLATLVGKRVFGRAQALIRAGIVVELEADGMPVAKLPTCAVRFHVPRDLAYARCDCQASLACEHVVVACWAFRHADRIGAKSPCTIELGAKRSRTDDGGLAASLAQPLEEAIGLAEHVIVEGVSHVSEADKVRFARVRASLAKAGLLWPASLVDDIEIALEAYRARSARYRTADVVFLLTSLEARVRAAGAGGELPTRFVLGSDEARETLLDHVRLVSLGARVEADGERREASVYLADPDSGVVLVASREFVPQPPTRPNQPSEPEEGPALARKTIAGRVTLGALARGQLVTRAAKRRANHSLTFGTSRSGQSSVAPSSGDWERLPRGLLVRDLDALTDDLRSRPPRVLRPRTLAAEMRVLALAPGAVREVAYRPGDQELVAVLAGEPPAEGAGAAPGGQDEDDERGGEGVRHIHLVRQHSRTGPAALDAIARALTGSVPPRFVAGDVRFGRRGLEVHPTAIVTDRIIVPDLETEPPMVERLPLLAPSPVGPMLAATGLAAGVLEEALHDGLGRLRGGFVDRATHAAEALSALGLAGASERIAALRDIVKAGDGGSPAGARAWLDASLRLELSREVISS